ncbi:spermine synthase [Ascoidea rubescens DSM 1968]|uniref:Spermine synthase n=1 Tax=Ascoidea rubescens DSM 1968 TaxID=1344418 RepID=A0A1D2VDI1_9ASCO|nr:spermine synthase [Ascoidea rubescens DSM 1968]ODV59696.1 spermine synthase [Ascoidea rubescens DSM 1968]
MSPFDLDNFSHSLIENGWFREQSDLHFPGQALQLKIKKILHYEKTQFQDVLVFQSETYGNVLVLDGIIQVSERDEFSYQEMITHLPLFSHPNPKKVLVIGGGDGGVLREVIKHQSVQQAILVEIDELVIELSKKFLPNMASSFNSPKVKVILDDGFKYLKNSSFLNESNKFDVIITDSSDPEGPAQEFFKENYFNLLYNALNKNGIVISQTSENFWLNFKFIKNLKKIALKVFPNVEFSYTCVPTYTSGQLGLLICSKDKNFNLKVPLRKLPPSDELSLFKYYNSDLHTASFVLPNWASNYLENNDNDDNNKVNYNEK